MTLIAAADGSALGNPGPAGWGWYIDENRWACGGWPHGTNNMGELTAVLDLLQQSAGTAEELLILCDSMYAINSITKWMAGWKRRNWRKGDGQPVQNLEIIKALDAAMQGRRVRFEWVKGHAGHPLNEEADRLANGAALAYSTGGTPDPGPGFGGGRAEAVTRSGPAEPEDLFGAYAEIAPPSDEERVLGLERSLLSDSVRADRAALAALLHRDWVEVGRAGRVRTRDEALDAIEPFASPVELEVVSVARSSADTILLIWREVTGGTSTVRSSLWVREGGDWWQRFHQGTPQP